MIETAAIIISSISLIVVVIYAFVLANYYYKSKMIEARISTMTDLLKKANDNVLKISQYVRTLGSSKKRDLEEELKWNERFNQTVLILNTFNERISEIESIVK